MNTLIIGDSFSADNNGWPSLLGLDIKNNFSHIWKQHPGDINHLNPIGNQIVADTIKKLIGKM